MQTLWLVGQFAVAAVLLWISSEWIVDSAAAVARRFGVSELVIGLTVVAMGTSAPEFLVTITAAFKQMSDISLSNVVGSNIFNLGFILGVMAVIKPLPTEPVLVWRDGGLLFCTTAAILGMAFAGTLGRLDGVVLLCLLSGYIGWLLWRGRLAGIAPAAERAVEMGESEVPDRPLRWWDWPRLAAGFVLLSLGGELMVNATRSLALSFGVSEWVIGVTVVAAGTSLPELVTCLAASLRGKNEMLLGNLIGSDFFNFSGVLGLTCLMRPLEVSPLALPGLMVLVGMVGLVLVFMRTGWRISRWEGALLILLNLMRWGWDFLG